MSKNLIRETNFRERSASYSTHGSKRGVSLLGWDAMNEEWLTAEQERAALKARVDQIVAIFTSGVELTAEERRTLGKEQHRLQTRMNQIRPRPGKCLPNISEVMLGILKERIGAGEFQALQNEAYRRIAALNK